MYVKVVLFFFSEGARLPLELIEFLNDVTLITIIRMYAIKPININIFSLRR